jgi:hypothetical protein
MRSTPNGEIHPAIRIPKAKPGKITRYRHSPNTVASERLTLVATQWNGIPWL